MNRSIEPSVTGVRTAALEFPIPGIDFCVNAAIRPIGVAVFLAQIEEEARLWSAAENLVHHRQRVVVGIGAPDGPVAAQ